MQTDVDASAFIERARSEGVADATILLLLRSQGWSDRRAQAALAAYYSERLGLNIPSQGGYVENARDAFFYLLSFLLLGTWAAGLIWLGDVLFDWWFPSAIEYAGAAFTRDSIAWQIATIVISFPVFMGINALIAREIARRPEALESGVRKWLTYIVLAVTGSCLVGDGIWFLGSFLTGDLTSRFMAKFFFLMLVTGGVFWYYLATIRPMKRRVAYDRIFAAGATVLVVAMVGAGFLAVGNPAQARARQFDAGRIERLTQLQGTIHTYFENNHQRLPKSMDQIAGPSDDVRSDPETSKPLEYIPGAGAAYRLCATFSSDDRQHPEDRTWAHPLGRYCFVRDAARDQ